MRYIGSKQNLLNDLDEAIRPYTANASSFCDIFSGTACVARHFKKDFKIISNDLLYFSYVIQRATIRNQSIPEFTVLKKHISKDPFVHLLDLDHKSYTFREEPFIFKHYSPNSQSERSYLSNDNALRIDMFRHTINDWQKNGLLQEGEFFYLLAGIIEAVPWVSNIAGTYGAFLKHWDKRALKTIAPVKYPVTDNKKENSCYNENANELIKSIDGDILYLDPPYNGRQYISNYHLLETVARYDNPIISGVTGIRSENQLSSDYCKKGKVTEAFRALLETAKFRYIVVSYSNEGIMSVDEIAAILENSCDKRTLVIRRIPYRRYKRTTEPTVSKLNELIFTIQK